MTREDWRSLMEDFVEGRLDGPDFERRFLDAWRAERDGSVRSLPAVDWLFYEVDAYCAYPEIRQPDDLDDEDLRAATRQALARIHESPPPRPVPSQQERADGKILDDVRRAFARLGRH